MIGGDKGKTKKGARDAMGDFLKKVFLGIAKVLFMLYNEY